jgi:hypothetical protein
MSAGAVPAGVLAPLRLFDPTLPDEYAPLLSLLFELEGLMAGGGVPKAERRARAVPLYRELTELLTKIEEPTPDDAKLGAPEFRIWFTEAVLLWVRFGQIGSTLSIDTVGAETLRQFPVDLPPDPATVESVQRALSEAFALTAEELASAQRKVEHLTSNLDLKRALTLALAAELGEDVAPERRVALLQGFYGPVPFRPGDVDVVIASTALFFFVPRKGTVLDVPGYAERPKPEQDAIKAFLEKVDRANTAETRRFPSFGLYEPEAMSPELIARLAERTSARPRVVQDTLATMFSLIQRSLHAQYLVHDLWGHTWQEALSEFEWEYALLPKLERPLGAADGPEFGGSGAPELASAFRAENGATVLDEARLLAFGEADLRGRIQVGTSVPLSEIFADFMEAKFSRSRPSLELPTSSLIPSTSLKADLSITDTRAQVRRYTKPYRKLAVDPADQARLVEELAARGLPRPGLAEAVARAGRALWVAFEPAFDDSLAPEPAGGGAPGLRSSVFRRLLLQELLVMADLERSLGRVRPDPSATDAVYRDPVLSPDLLVVALTHFYERDRQKNFWQMDQIARNEFGPACAALKARMR